MKRASPRYRRLAVSLAVAVVGMSGLAFAQAVFAQAGPQTGPLTGPLLIDRDRIDRQAPASEGRTKTPTVPHPASISPAAPAIAAFVLKQVKVQGAASLDPARLADTYKDKIGTMMTIADIGIITDRIGELYRAAGFPLYSVAVPNQNFAGGVLIVHAAEGYVDNVVIDGDTVDADLDLLRAYAAKIVADRPLRHATLARYLLLMNDIPGLKVGSRFDQTPDKLGVTLRLTIARKHFDLGTAFDNQGSRFLDRLQFTATATANALLQQGDRTELIYGFPADFRDYRYYGFTHMEPLGTEGATVQLSGSYLRTHPDGSPISGDAYSGGVSFGVPVLRQQEENVTLIGSFDTLYSANGFLGQTFSNERTRAVRGGVAYSAGPLDGSAQTGISAVLSQGLDILGARGGGGGIGGPVFTKLNLRLSHDHVIFSDFIARLKASAQYAPGAVPASEEFSYGGGDFGRAFGSAEVVGDRGVEGGAELAYRVPIAWTGAAFLSNAETYGFYDIGKLWFASDLLRSPNVGQSAGMGVRVRVADRVTLQIEAGFPLECPSRTNSCGVGRGLFSLTSKF